MNVTVTMPCMLNKSFSTFPMPICNDQLLAKSKVHLITCHEGTELE